MVQDFSHYRILARIGEGGMGEVYAADDLRLNRKVALKFLLPGAGRDDPADPTNADRDRHRILREARAAAQLDHPFICKVYDVGEHDGRAFLAMEYVEGGTLAERMPGSQTVDDTIRLCAEIAEALHLAHARGIVHRDLKPSNVMVGDDGHIKVMDFGIARRMRQHVAGVAETDTTAVVTNVGGPTGTLAYMSPEQIRDQPVDGRSDLFSFGVLLYELLTRTHPFRRATVFDTAHAILYDPPPPLEHALPAAPPLLAHIVNRCLEKDPRQRYQSLDEVRQQLNAVRTSHTTAVVPRLPARRSRWWPLTAAAAVLVLAAASGYWFRASFVTATPALAFHERDWIVVADINNLTGDPVFDTSLRVALEVAIGQSQYVNVYPAGQVEATLQRMQKRRGKLDEALAAEVAVRDGVRGVLACDIAQLGNAYVLTARLVDPTTRAAVHTDLVQAKSKDTVLTALGELATRVRSSLGESLTSLSARSLPLPRATTSSLEALKLYADSVGPDRGANPNVIVLLQQAINVDPEFALAHAEMGRLHYLGSARADREQGEQHFIKALQFTDRLSLRERLWIQAVAEDSRGNRDQAVEAYRSYVSQYPDDATAWFRLAWTQMATLDQPREAINGFKQALRIRPNDATAYVNLATCYAGIDDLNAAIPAYQQAFALNSSLLFAPFVNHEYGFTLVGAGRLAEAESVFTKMRDQPSAGSQSKGHRSLALLHQLRGKYALAVDEFRRAALLNHSSREQVSEFRDRMYLVSALDGQGRHRDADAEWKTVASLIGTMSLDPAWLWRPVRRLARLGRTGEAERLMGVMQKGLGSTADSSVARNLALDQRYIDAAQAEIELARGRTARAIELLEPSRDVLKLDIAESLAAAYAAAGRIPDAVGRYEDLIRVRPPASELQQVWIESQLALGGLYERIGRSDDAQRLYAMLVDRWKEADPDLPLLATARSGWTRTSKSTSAR
jgi:serine/threonine protein kinase/tetratricopeptide (TPR) repeat protein